MNILLIGPEGCGKTTHADALAVRYHQNHLDMGEIIRLAAKESTQKAVLIDHLANQKGRLLPDGVVIDLLIEYLSGHGFDNQIFDGYPRTLNQYRVLAELLSSKNQKIDAAYYLDVNETESVRRVMARQRPDDQPQAITFRLEQFHHDTQPIIDALEAEHLLQKIDAGQPFAEVHKALVVHIEATNRTLPPDRRLQVNAGPIGQINPTITPTTTTKEDPNYRTLFVITHTESDYNKRDIFTGRLEVELTEEGHQKAELSAEILKNEKIGLAVRSSMIRNRQTLDHILKYHPETKVEIDDRFIERDYGELSGLSKTQYAKEHPDLYPIYHRSYDVTPPGGESMQTVETRVLAGLQAVITRMQTEKINALIVAHSNSIRPIRRYFEHLTPEEMMALEHLRHRIFTYKIPV